MHLKLINLNDPYMYNSIEICAGAGGQALGLEMAGFSHVALVEYEKDYCECLKRNRQEWNIFCKDVQEAYLALRLVLQANNWELMMSVIFFLRCSDLCRKLIRVSL